MAITQEALAAAVEQFLPKTVNFAYDADSGEQDADAIYSRVKQIVLTALATEVDAVFHLVGASAMKFLEQAQTTRVLLETLQGSDQLRAVDVTPPARIEDTTALEAARIALSDVSGKLINGSFSEASFSTAQEGIAAFLTGPLQPNVQGRNQALVDADLQASLESLAASWADLLASRDALLAIVPDYQANDLRTVVAGTVIRAVTSRVQEIEVLLPTLTTREQALRAETLLVDLAAALASLGVVGSLPTPFGTVRGEIYEDGETPRSYLDAIGTATPVSTALLSGDGGRVHLDYAWASATGGSVDDGDEDTTTGIFEDLSATFLEDWVGYTLTIVDTGTGHLIKTVDGTRCLVLPEVPVGMSNVRYIVSELRTGSYFSDAGESFWLEFSGETPAAPVVASGDLGEFPEWELGEGRDGVIYTEVCSGVTGRVRFEVCSGNDGVVHVGLVTFTSVSATFITDGVEAGDLLDTDIPGTWNVASVPLETILHVDEALVDEETGVSYAVYRDPTRFFDDNADFVSDGVLPGDILVVNGDIPREVSSVVSATELGLATGIFSTLTYATWKIYRPSSSFSDVNAAFLTWGVAAGDILEIYDTGTDLDGEYTIDSVGSETELGFASDFPEVFNPLTVLWRVWDTSHTYTFAQADNVDFVTEQIGATSQGARSYLVIDGDAYPVAAREGSTALRVEDLVAVDAGPLAWEIRSGTKTTTLIDTTSAPFGSSSAGDPIVLFPRGNSEVRTYIESVTSASEVELGVLVDAGQEEVPYALPVFGDGADLVVYGRRVSVVRVESEHVLLVQPPLPLHMGVDVDYDIVRHDAEDGTQYLHVSTEVTAGATLFLLGDTPVTAPVLLVDPEDPLLVKVGTRVPLWRRSAAFKSIVSSEMQTNVLSSAASPETTTGDYLTVWGIPDMLAIQEDGTLSFTPAISSGMRDLPFVVTYGGSPAYGRYLLLLHLLDAIGLSPDVEELRPHLSEVLYDHGSTYTTILEGEDAIVTPDGDGDGTSPWFDAEDVAGVRVGDRVLATMDGDEYVTYVAEVLASRLVVDPKLPEGAVSEWRARRTSVSYSLYEADVLRLQLVEVESILSEFSAPKVAALDQALSLLNDRGLTRAAKALSEGRTSDLLDLSATTATDTGAVKAAVQTVGSSMTATGASTPTSALSTVLATGETSARRALASGVAYLEGAASSARAAQASLDEFRNRAVYELDGTVVDGMSTESDDTLPWLEQTGTDKDRLLRRIEEMRSALQYLIDHPDEFESP